MTRHLKLYGMIDRQRRIKLWRRQERTMKCLEITLVVKIIFTTICWFMPLLFFPAPASRWLGIPEPRPILFAHLLGAAFGSLLVGYSLGLRDSLQGQEIENVIWTGAVSNGLAFALLVIFRKDWRRWQSRRAQVYMWLSTVMTLLITVGLIVCGLFPGSIARR
jgi:hypothetical protein